MIGRREETKTLNAVLQRDVPLPVWGTAARVRYAFSTSGSSMPRFTGS